MADEASDGAGRDYARLAIAAAGQALRFVLLWWLFFWGYFLVVVVGILLVWPTRNAERLGAFLVVVLVAVGFAGTLGAWGAVRRRRGRPLRPDGPAVEDPEFPVDLFAGNGSLHPNVLTVLFVRLVVAVVSIGFVAALVVYLDVIGRTGLAVGVALAVTGGVIRSTWPLPKSEPRAALVLVAGVLVLFCYPLVLVEVGTVPERAILEWMVGVGLSVFEPTVVVATALVLATTTVALWVVLERTAFAWTLAAAGGGVQFSAVVGDAAGARRFGRRVAAGSRRTAVACRRVARRATERVDDASGRERRERREKRR